MLTRVQFEAQNARVTQSLKNDGADSSLFSLYLAMQITDPTLHDACELDVAEEQGLYTGISSQNTVLYYSNRANLYSCEADYNAQDKLYSAIATSLQPNIYLQFLNAMRPQPLHFSERPELIPDDVIDNLPLSSQHRYKVTNTDALSSSADTLHQNTNNDSYAFTDHTLDKSSVRKDDDLPNNAGLDAFLQNIEQAKEFAF